MSSNYHLRIPKGILVLGLFLFFCLLVRAQEPQGHLPNETENVHASPTKKHGHESTDASPSSSKLNPSKIILEHVLDGYSFHFFDYNGKSYGIDLPIIVYSKERGWSVFSSGKFNHGHSAYEGYALGEGNKIVAVDEDGKVDSSIVVWDVSISRNIAQMWLACLLLLLVGMAARRAYRKHMAGDSPSAPKGLQNMMEAIIVFVRDDIALPNLKHKTNRYLPFLLSVFFFILINNLFGLIPGSANVTGNIAFTMLLSVIAFLMMLFSSSKGFWAHLVWPPGIPIGAKIILIPVEFLGIFVKPFALMVRLFANMLAGHIIIVCFVVTIFVLANLSKGAGWGFSPLSVAFMIFIYTMEVLVAFIQAYIFTTLTSVFMGQMMEGGEEHH